MRVLLTGIGGFAGPVVAAALRAADHRVHGLVRHGSERSRPLPADALSAADLEDPAAVAEVVAAVVPDAVVHLAGLTFVPAAEREPHVAYRTNVEGTVNLLAAARAHAPRARILCVTSGEVYGAIAPAELPITEDTPMRPRSVYGASKAAADLAAAQWGRAYGLHIVRARPFNHTGPGQDAAFVCSGLARQIALIETGAQPAEVRVGNLDSVRDFSDVRDIAAGYVALLERGRPGEAYNLCSGQGASIAEVLAILRTQARLPLRVVSDPALRRPGELERVVGSHDRATRDTGWVPRITLGDTLAAVLEDWRRRVAAHA